MFLSEKQERRTHNRILACEGKTASPFLIFAKIWAPRVQGALRDRPSPLPSPTTTTTTFPCKRKNPRALVINKKRRAPATAIVVQATLAQNWIGFSFVCVIRLLKGRNCKFVLEDDLQHEVACDSARSATVREMGQVSAASEAQRHRRSPSKVPVSQPPPVSREAVPPDEAAAAARKRVQKLEAIFSTLGEEGRNRQCWQF